ncbi:polyisoprenoid-binding protein [Echinicola pacifica]|uniref:Polyisoprenoid-binding protein n=1 Tax=Echinicola pacifica TaxID=346377 RepID=A0A918USD3_9BACT|nr:YceI family protein [Echinicola pacifica]GGZ30782.1 polyisoprenoid-binding protein [Echinicola pacifica]
MVSTLKKLSLAVLVTAISAAGVQAQDATMWQIDKAHTSVNFSISHFFTPVTGKFNEFEGAMSFDPDQLEASSASFTVAVNSVDTENEKRNNHLQSPDFFDAETYPSMSFTSTKFEEIRENEYLIHGKLTIKDVTKEVSLPMTVKGQMDHPMKEGMVILGLTIDLSVDRTDYGVGTGDWAATMVVGDEVEIHIPMELHSTK